MRHRRIYHPEISGSGETLALSREESHHAGRVLRLRAGDVVSVFDGKGREWSAVIVSINQGEAVVEVGDEIGGSTDPELSVLLCQGLCRHDRMEWVIQKGTEIGMSGLLPVTAGAIGNRTVTRKRLERWRRIALEACKQSGRRMVPNIREPGDLPVDAEGNALRLLLHPGPGSEPARSVMAGPVPSGVCIAVGPEGGFNEAEVKEYTGAGWVRISLGPRVLRTETAGLVGLSLVLNAWGDLGLETGSG